MWSKDVKIISKKTNRENFSPLKVLYFLENEIESQLNNIHFKPKIAIGHISYKLDFKEISFKIKNILPKECEIVLTSANDLLCNINQQGINIGNPYTGCANSSGIVLVLFSEEMIENLYIHKIRLFSDEKNYEKRKEYIEKEILSMQIPFKTNYYNTLHYMLYDGLSQSESSVVEMIFKHAKHPCALIGGGLAEI